MNQWLNNKSMILSSIALLFFGNACGSELIIHEQGFSAAQKLGVLKVLRDQEGYAILTKSGAHKVHNHDIDAPLKKMSNEQLATFLNDGNGTIRVTQFNNGEFNLKTHIHGNGGGAVGAAVGVVAGTALVQGVAHGTIWTIAACTGPFVFFVGYGLEAACAPAIHSATIYAAAVGGMTGAVATGPI